MDKTGTTQTERAQIALKGMWREPVPGCPHRRARMEGLDVCEINGNGGGLGVCVYDETPHARCEVFAEIIEELKADAGICGECGQHRPGDERVKAGMKCGECAGY